MAKDEFNKVASPKVLEKIGPSRNADKLRANDQHKPAPPQLAPGQSSIPRGYLGPSQAQIDESQRRDKEIKDRLNKKDAQQAPQRIKEKALTREFNKTSKL